MSSPETLTRMITGYWASQAVYAAAWFGVADLLREGPKSVDHLAQACGAQPDALYRLLRALASLGIFTEGEPRQFSLTPAAEMLRSDVEGSQRALALMSGGAQFQAWGEIVYSIQTGQSAFEKQHGQPLFEFLAAQPDQAAIFDEAMTGIHGRESAAVLQAYDFSGINALVDVGGGNGSQLAIILHAHPELRGILFDLPHVAERTRHLLAAAGLEGRCQVLGGNFFQSVPSGADTILLRHIVHDWNDEQSLTILRNCRAALPPEGKLLVIESVIPTGNEPCAGKLLDLTMLLIPGGKERTQAEYNALFRQAGFELTRVVPTTAEVSVLECRLAPSD